MSEIAYRAMVFACEAHKTQKRKYTGSPYSEHLAEVAGIVSTVDARSTTIAVAWLHDCVEDCGVQRATLEELFGYEVAWGVHLLSDMEKGNRAERKHLARVRLAAAPSYVQTIKCADLLSNTKSIFEHDPTFSIVYRKEAQALLAVLGEAHPALGNLAKEAVRSEDGMQK